MWREGWKTGAIWHSICDLNFLSTYDDDFESPEEDTGSENEAKSHRGQANESSYFDKVKLIAYH